MHRIDTLAEDTDGMPALGAALALALTGSFSVANKCGGGARVFQVFCSAWIPGAPGVQAVQGGSQIVAFVYCLQLNVLRVAV